MNSNAKQIISSAAVLLVLGSLTASAAHASATASAAQAILAVGQSQAAGGDTARQAQDYLAKARSAIRDRNYELAEVYINRAERLNVKYDPLLVEFQDTPQKLRRELDALRGPGASSSRLPSSQFSPAASNSASPAPSRGGSYNPAAADNAINALTERANTQPGAQRSPFAGNPSQFPRSAADNVPPLGPSPFPQGAIRNPYSEAGNQGAPGANQQSHSDQLLLQARRALAVGDAQAAGRFAAQASQLGVNYPPYGDSPAKVENLIRKAAQFDGPPPPNVDRRRYTRDHADLLLEQAEGLLRYKDLAGAERLAQRAKGIPAEFASFERSPDKLLAQIGAQRAAAASQGAGTGGTLSDLPSRLHSPSGNASPAKTQAMRLVAQGKAAFDRGDLMAAHKFAAQAYQMRVPEPEFAANDTRPWQLMMQVEGAMRDRGISPAQAASYDVQDAGYADQDRGQRFPVSQGVYNPQADATRNVAAQAQSPTPGRRPPSAGSANSTGARLYRQGIDALRGGDRNQALDLFRQAWQHQADLNPTVRAQLKEKLNLLQAADLAPAAGRGQSPLESVDAEQRVLYQSLFREIASEQKEAERMAADDPKGALARLQEQRNRVEQSGIDAGPRKQLLTIVDRSIQSLQQYIDENEGAIELAERNRRILASIEQDQQNLYDLQNKLAELVEKFNELMDEQRWEEAEVIAFQARELAPEETVVQNLIWKSQFVRRMSQQRAINEAKERGFYSATESVLDSSTPFDDRFPYEFPDAPTWRELSRIRKDLLQRQANQLSPAEQEIQQSLSKKVEVRFTDRPLNEVLDTLSVLSGVPIHPDPQGLSAEAVTTATPVTINLQQPISLKSALNLILEPLHLSYIIENEVLRVTSEQVRHSNTRTEVYNVADLVIPIPNFVPSYDIGIPGALRESYNAMGYGSPLGSVAPSPLTLAVNNNDRQGAISPLALAQSASSMAGGAGARPTQGSFGPGGLGGGSQADFDSLIELITTTIAPDSWDEVGGPGAIAPFETNLSLVVSQTQEIHDQIADLLKQLRRLQDLQVTIEVRFITISDNFFERIGIDFDFEIDDNSGLRTASPALPDDDGNSIVIGLDETGAPTADLDLIFNQNTLGVAVPQFGGFTPANATNFGFAILSDIEAFFLVQAAQGDSRTNVLQAPKVTLFNGQQANVSDTSQRPFVTSIIPVVGDFAAAHQPVIMVLNEGTSMNVQAVVSDDRRFVRLTLVPFFSSIGNVETFTFDGTTTTNSGSTVLDPDGNPVDVPNNGAISTNSGTTVQLPQFNFTTVTTTVSVPDGGTVLLGGIKRLSEGRNERGLPLLSKVPYVNRLFRNVGIGRETQSLMMMVTPRIIIQEEEEEKRGFAVED